MSFVGREYSGTDSKTFFGKEAQNLKTLKFTSPVKNGKIHNWDDMISLWEHGFNKQLRMSSSEQPCLLTEAVQQSHAQREKSVQVMFENFNVPAFSLKKCELLSLICHGKSTGLVLNVGHSLTSSVPIVDGYIGHMMAVESANFGGEDITNYLITILDRKIPNNHFNIRYKIGKQIKQKFCQFAKYSNSQSYFELPDGQVITIGQEKHKSAQIIFYPELIGKQPGLHIMANKSIQHYQKEEGRRYLCSNIILSGGSSAIQGFPSTVCQELTNFLPISFETKCRVENTIHSAWFGGSILASLSTFQESWITKTQYEQTGKGIVHKAY